MRSFKRKNVLLGVVFSLFVFSVIISRRRNRLSVEDVKNLPVSRTEMREKEDCPGVMEKIEYRKYIDDEGNEEEIGVIFVGDDVLESVLQDKERPWLKASFVTRPNLNCLKQDNDKLIKVIKENYLKPPSKSAGNPYNLVFHSRILIISVMLAKLMTLMTFLMTISTMVSSLRQALWTLNISLQLSYWRLKETGLVCW